MEATKTALEQTRHPSAQFARQGTQETREDPGDPRSGRGNGGPNEGVDLGSMRKRAEMLGGRLSIDSESESGTVVEVWVPLAD
jgi:signal transduction histidine kinase